MNENLTLFLTIFLSVDAAALVLLLWYFLRREAHRRKVLHFGDRAEEAVAQYVETQFPGAILLNDLYLHAGGQSTTQIDHVLLCKWGVYVIETKSHNGKINVSKKEWVQIYNDKVIYFHSPVLQNEAHCKALERVLKKNRLLERIPVKGLVVFTSKKVRFSKQVPDVIRLDELGPTIKNGGKLPPRGVGVTAKPGKRYLSRQTILLLEKQILKASDRSFGRKKRHDRALRGKRRSVV